MSNPFEIPVGDEQEGGAMQVIGKKFKAGDKVECNGNKEGRVIGYYSTAMVEVRLWSNGRHVGDVCVAERDIKSL